MKSYSLIVLSAAVFAAPHETNLGQAIATTPEMGSRQVISGGPGNDLIDARNIEIVIDNNQRLGTYVPGLGYPTLTGINLAATNAQCVGLALAQTTPFMQIAYMNSCANYYGTALRNLS